MEQYVGEILLRHGVIEKEKLQEALQTAEERGLQLADVLVRKGDIEEETLVEALAKEMGMPLMPKIQPDDVPEHLIELIPITFARQHHVIPVADRDGVVTIAIANPLDSFVVDDVRALLSRPVEAVASTSEAIDDVINRVYQRKDEAALGDKEDDDDDGQIEDLLDATDEAPVIRFVNNLFYTAVQDRASDIHIEPTDDAVVVRYRIDGSLVQRKQAPRGALAAIIARVKIEAGLNIAEKRLPQDGRITKKVRGKVIDVRVSTIPTAKGESVVMRLLDKENIMLDLVDLGFARRELDVWNQLIERPNGIILITGPTGSGKTTTLYGSLNRINKPDIKILTAENPVEYELRGINQLQVHAKIGLTFAAALRAFLRQDPDVIMVGEIRDFETAELAIQASLTGHLVLSTLHTNDAPGAITRLVDMKIEPFQISSTVLAVLAQRLVRRLCVRCREPYAATQENLIELGLDMERLDEELAELQRVAKTTVLGRNSDPAIDLARVGLFDPDLDLEAELGEEPTVVRYGSEIGKPTRAPRAPVFYRPVGCEHCNGGYRGRMGIFELMIVDEAIRREILSNSDANTIAKTAQQRGMRTLRQDGARQVLAGVTSVEEVLAATQAGEVEMQAPEEAE